MDTANSDVPRVKYHKNHSHICPEVTGNLDSEGVQALKPDARDEYHEDARK